MDLHIGLLQLISEGTMSDDVPFSHQVKSDMLLAAQKKNELRRLVLGSG
jgi:hypothetical protein